MMGRTLFVLYASVFLNVMAYSQESSNGHSALIDLYREFLKFRRPEVIDGVPDYSPASIQEKEKGLATFRKRLSEISHEDWTVAQKIDYLLVRAKLNDLDFQLRVTRPWERDPGTYVDMIARIPYADTPLSEESKENWLNRLKAVPKILEQAKVNLTGVSEALAGITIRRLEQSDGVNQGEPRRDVPPEGVIGWYQDLIERLSEHHPELLAGANQALSSVESYCDWLRSNKSRMTAPVSIGLDNYNWYLKNVRLMPYTVDDVLKIAEVEYYRTLAFLRIEQHKNRHLPEIEPASTAEEHERRVREAETLIRSFIDENDLLTIPDYMPPRFDTDAFWIVRPGGKRHFWEEITYRDPLNNHIHASIPGHRFDSLIQRRNTHPIRGRYGDGGRAEGWTFYLEEMFLQAGLLDERPRTRELFYIAQLKRVLRVPAEIKMQTGELTLEQAIEFLVNEVPLMEEDLARYDLQIYLRQPAYGMTYLAGKVQFEKLLSDRARQLGKNFDLGKFHDEFLTSGSIPITLIRWEMTGLDDEVKKLWGNDLTLENLYPEVPLIGVPPSNVVWSPDESCCAFLWNSESLRIKNLYCFFSESAEKPIQLTSFEKEGIAGFCWGRTKNEIFFLRGTSIYSLNINDQSIKEIWNSKKRIRSLFLSPDSTRLSCIQNRNLWIYNLKSGSSYQLTKFDPSHEGINRYSWSPDSEHILFYYQDYTGIRQVGIPSFGREEVQIRKVPRPFPGDAVNKRKIGVVGIPQGEISWIPMEFDNLLSYSWSPSGNKILIEDSTEYATKRCLYVCDAEDMATEEVFLEESPLFTFSWLWSSQWLDDDRIVLTSDRSGFCHLYSLDLEEKQLKELTSGEWEVFDFFPAKGGELYFIANKSRPENRDLYKVHLGEGGTKRINDRDGVYKPFFSRSGKNICVLFSDDLTPFDLYFVRDGALRQITESPFPEFKKYAWAKTQYLDIPGGKNGTKVRVKMMFPLDFNPDKKYPAIIGSVYSNAVLNQWGGRDAHPTWGLDQYLVQVEKYVLVNVDIRGSLGYGRKFREDMFKGYGVVDIQDLEAAALYLKTQPYILPDKIGIWGSSYGGLLTLMSLFKIPGLFCCGIAGAPATNVFHSFPGQMEVMKSADDKIAYEDSSAYFWSQNLEAPVMIIHGILDSTVLFMDSVNLVQKMIREGKDVDFVVLPESRHGWDLGPSYQTLFAFKKMIDFFATHLKD
jgi:dipeptidyl aminopeptidase/acylaminoacyl peptidase